jgi:adenylyltransferase/sulfurtransferase
VLDCDVAGVLGVLPGIVGTIQAAEALKLLLGVGEPLIGRMLIYDALGARFDEIAIPRDPACVTCGSRVAPSRHPAVAPASA